jgi:phosphoribosylformylglycinamidine (FGAM) synthase-like amidotransferase family enzyme
LAAQKKSAFGDACGREGAANSNGPANNIAGIYSKGLNVLVGQT